MNHSLLVVGVLLFMLGSALAAAVLRDVVGSIVAFAGYSFGVAILWAFLRAPDVALTEAAVGAGITTVLFLLTIARTTVSRSERFEGIGLRSGLASPSSSPSVRPCRPSRRSAPPGRPSSTAG